MRVLLVAGPLLLLIAATQAGAVSSLAAPFTAGAQTEPADFTRPDVGPLPAEGKFQVVSDTAWAGDKVRVFFLGAQF